MTDHYENWRKRRAGEEVKTFLQPQMNDCGYYRLPITNRKQNGQTDITDWVPVAIFPDGDKLAGLVGAGEDMVDMSSTQLCGEQFWSWICRNHIDYEVYDAVANNGEPWPDSKEVQLVNTMGEEKVVPAANREVNRNHNAAPEEEVDNRPEHEKVAEAIDRAIAVSKAHAITDQPSAEIGLGIVNRLAELRLSAKRRGEELYKPHYNKYVAIRDAWKPPVDRSETEEKRQTANINAWKRAEEKRLRDEAEKAEAERKRLEAEAAAKRAEEEERAARAADRAIAEGIPPAEQEAPEFDEFEEQHDLPPLSPTPVQPTTVALIGTYGKRKLRDTPVEPTFTIDDLDAVYHHFKKLESVKACLTLLVKAAVKSNIAVPGVTVTKPEE